MSRHWRSLGAIAVVTVVPGVVLTSASIRYLLRDVVVVDDELTGWSNDRIWLAAVFWVVAMVAGAIGTIGATWLLLRAIDADRGLDPRESAVTLPIDTGTELRAAGRALRAALAALPRVIGWTIVAATIAAAAIAALAVIIVFALPIGLILALGCIPLGFYLAIRFAFVGHALADGRGNPFARSATVSRARFWPVCGRVLLVGVIAYGMSVVANIAVSTANGTWFGDTERYRVAGQPDSFDFAAVSPSPLVIVVSAVIGAVSGVVVTGLIAAAFGELYRTSNPAPARPVT
jgi:hypothetical protein